MWMMSELCYLRICVFGMNVDMWMQYMEFCLLRDGKWMRDVIYLGGQERIDKGEKFRLVFV